MRAFDEDVGRAREAARRTRLRRLAIVLGIPGAYLWYRIVSGRPVNFFTLPSLPNDPYLYLLPTLLIVVLIAVIAMPLASGRSPHLEYRPEQIDIGLEDFKGLDVVVEEVVKTLNTFLGYAVFRGRLGGNPRRGLLFEGPPGTGKTHLAKAMAREAGVPFLFVSATSFQSMWYGATARKIRSYFRQLRRVARREGGAIGFIEEIDAIAGARSGMRSNMAEQPLPACPSAPTAEGGLVTHSFGSSEGASGVVNELLIQLQSFDTPPASQRAYNALAALDPASVTVDGKSVELTLPEPTIFATRLDNGRTRVYARETGLFSSPDPELESETRREAERQLTQAALDGGILRTAAANARNTLTSLLLGLGFETVNVHLERE